MVTSCPSDSPDDYTALTELKAKPKLREKFGVEDAWVNFEVSNNKQLCSASVFPQLGASHEAGLRLNALLPVNWLEWAVPSVTLLQT